MIQIPTRRMDDQTEAEKIRAVLKKTRDTREYARNVAVGDGKIKRATRGLGVKDTPDYKANLVKHEALSRESLKVGLIS